jgi:hypothetical protein
MGRLHDKWKAAKAKVKLVNVQQMFRMDFGSALDAFEKGLSELFNRVFPDGKTSSTPLTYGQLYAVKNAIEPEVAGPGGGAAQTYLKAVVAAREQNARRLAKAKQALEKRQCEDIDKDLEFLGKEVIGILDMMAKDVGDFKDRVQKLILQTPEGGGKPH